MIFVKNVILYNLLGLIETEMSCFRILTIHWHQFLSSGRHILFTIYNEFVNINDFGLLVGINNLYLQSVSPL